MSLSNTENASNPTKKYLKWKGGLGVWEYYDKDNEKKVELDEKLFIVPLDELSTVKGWHDASQSGIYSNEIHKIKEEELVVRSFKGGEIARGLYNDIKGKLEGGKYCKSVYAVLLNSKGEVIEPINFSFSGSSLSSWIDAKIKVSEGNIITLEKNPEVQTKGATKYYIPKITIHPRRDSILEECKSIDKQLQDYLSQYKKSSTEEPKGMSPNQEFVGAITPTHPVGELAIPEANDTDDLPF